MATQDDLNLARLRPLMSRSEVEGLLGAKLATEVLRTISNFGHRRGVHVDFSNEDDAIDAIRFAGNFPSDVDILGVRIAQTADPLRTLTRLESSTDGVEIFTAQTEGVLVRYFAKDGRIQDIDLVRPDLAAAQAERKRRKEEREAAQERARALQESWKTIEDPDEMLRTWARYCAPWDDTGSEFVEFAQWLVATKNPDQWHVVADHWNWDNGMAPLFWIAGRKDCDVSTALLIFFRADPIYYASCDFDAAKTPEHAQEGLKLCRLLRDRFKAGFYTRSRIAMDRDVKTTVASLSRQTPDKRAQIEAFFPEPAFSSLEGRDLSRDNVGKLADPALAEALARLAPLP